MGVLVGVRETVKVSSRMMCSSELVVISSSW